jgi:hypothetical protein
MSTPGLAGFPPTFAAVVAISSDCGASTIRNVDRINPGVLGNLNLAGFLKRTDYQRRDIITALRLVSVRTA